VITTGGGAKRGGIGSGIVGLNAGIGAFAVSACGRAAGAVAAEIAAAGVGARTGRGTSTVCCGATAGVVEVTLDCAAASACVAAIGAGAACGALGAGFGDSIWSVGIAAAVGNGFTFSRSGVTDSSVAAEFVAATLGRGAGT
jgi:hypothetical protein